jgi:hypothetical protein
MRQGRALNVVRASALAGLLAAAPSVAASESGAEACGTRSVCGSRSVEYVGAHSLAAGALAALAIITDNAIDPALPDVTPVSKTMEAAANGLLGLELLLPAAAYTATMRTAEAGDAALSYAQSSLAAITANHLLRLGTLNSSAPVAFATAVTSSLLLEQRRPLDATGGEFGRPAVDIRVRGTFWGLQLSLASANAILAARSGRSSFLDVGLGAGLGVGVAMVVEAAHRKKGFKKQPAPALFATGEHALFIHVTNASLLALGLVLPWLPRAPSDDPALRVGPAALGPGAAGAAVEGAF